MDRRESQKEAFSLLSVVPEEADFLLNNDKAKPAAVAEAGRNSGRYAFALPLLLNPAPWTGVMSSHGRF